MIIYTYACRIIHYTYTLASSETLTTLLEPLVHSVQNMPQASTAVSSFVAKVADTTLPIDELVNTWRAALVESVSTEDNQYEAAFGSRAHMLTHEMLSAVIQDKDLICLGMWYQVFTVPPRRYRDLRVFSAETHQICTSGSLGFSTFAFFRSCREILLVKCVL